MFLKTLTLKGFKSFADTTSLEFEPGVTVVVGGSTGALMAALDSWRAHAARSARHPERVPVELSQRGSDLTISPAAC